MEAKRWHGRGDHRLVTIAAANTEVTFYLTNANTSANDTTTSKYFDNIVTEAIQFDIVADQAITLEGTNGEDLTDGIPMAKNASYGEKNIDGLTAIKIKTTTDNTQISVRVR